MARLRKGMFRRAIRHALGFAAMLLALSLAGCGGVSPPVGIPAPVSQLMQIQGPDPTGVVAVVGEPGSVLPDAVVSAANLDQGGQVIQASRWQAWLFGVAVAQTSPNSPIDQTERAVVAASDGSFRMRLTGTQGDTLRFVQNVGGEKSPPTDVTVPPPATPVPAPLAPTPQPGATI
ncbi:MAG TPA: hypothetical protein VJR29_02715 [bacterium]|nr:hypothetical protein [bacterium]